MEFSMKRRDFLRWGLLGGMAGLAGFYILHDDLELMLHCHNLEHEDNMMMTQFRLS
jgi:FtsP/CotA-like multicopper oxidase with cupredoxin domain